MGAIVETGWIGYNRDMIEIVKKKLEQAKNEYEAQVKANGYVGDEMYLLGKYDGIFELWKELNGEDD